MNTCNGLLGQITRTGATQSWPDSQGWSEANTCSALSAPPTQQSSQYSSPSNGANPVTPTVSGNSSMPDLHTSNRTRPLSHNSSIVIQSMDSRSHSSDILEKARVAIASAERASAAARAAAQLANINFGTLKREGGQS